MLNRTKLFTSVLTGVLITAPLMAALYLGEQVAGLPFPPFDVFDWVARTLPGDIIGKGIETLVELIRELDLGETSSTAKTIETLGALATFFGGGVVAAAILFLALDRVRTRSTWASVIAGALLGLPVILISLEIDRYQTDTLSGVLWLVLAFALWGMGTGWMAGRLREPAADAAIPAEARTVTRRQFLVTVGGATATLTVIGSGLARTLEYLDEKDYQEQIRRNRAAADAMAGELPNRDDPVTPAPGTRPEYTPLEDHYRIDINVRAVEVDEDDWRLKIAGLVDNPLSLTVEDLKNGYDPLDQYVTLACISNPVGGDLTSTTRWTGARLQDILRDAGVQPEATHLKITSNDGFYETVALDLVNEEPRVMLTYHWDGIPLLQKHGFPLRVYVPDLYGMKQPKWITEIEVMDHDEDGYWVDRGWDKVARMRATSVVDVVAGDSTFEQDGVTYVPVGGIAHAGARGISRVEVKVDDGDWTEAQLRGPLSETTWVIWRYDWPFEAGRHAFEVRCVEGDGAPQSEEKRSTHPSGATGIHRLTRNV